MRDQIINIDLAIHIPVNDLRYIGASLGTTKGGAPAKLYPVTNWNGLVAIS